MTITTIKNEVVFGGEVMKDIKNMVKNLKKDKDVQVLNNAVFQFGNDQLTVTAASIKNGNVSIVSKFDVDTQGGSSLLVPFDVIKKVTHIKKDSQYKFEVNDNKTVSFYKNGAIQQFPFLGAENFPKLPKLKGDPIGNVNYDEVLNLNKALTSIAKTETRPVLQTVLLRDGKIASTDSHRLFQTASQVEHSDDLKLHETGIKKLKDVFNKKDNITVTIDNNYISYSNDSTNVVIGLYKGSNYPELSRLIPEYFNTEFTIYNTREFTQAIKDASDAVIDERNNVVKFEITKDELIITAGHVDSRKYYNKVQIDNFSGEDLTIQMSGKYLLDGLKQLNADSVSFKFVGRMRPFVISPANNGEALSLILPVRTY